MANEEINFDPDDVVVVFLLGMVAGAFTSFMIGGLIYTLLAFWEENRRYKRNQRREKTGAQELSTTSNAATPSEQSTKVDLEARTGCVKGGDPDSHID